MNKKEKKLRKLIREEARKVLKEFGSQAQAVGYRDFKPLRPGRGPSTTGTSTNTPIAIEKMGDLYTVNVNYFMSIKNKKRPACHIRRIVPNDLEHARIVKDRIEEMGVKEFLKRCVQEDPQLMVPRYKFRCWVDEDSIKFQEYDSAKFSLSMDR